MEENAVESAKKIYIFLETKVYKAKKWL